MALEQLTLEKGLNKVEFAIQLLQKIDPSIKLYLADSGGVDSCVTRDILIRSGRLFDAHYCVSPIDPPQIWSFLKEHHPDTQWDYHAKGFWKMVHKKGLPMRQSRWCCEVIKEAGGNGRHVVVGNLRAESRKRSKQPDISLSYKGNLTYVRPIANFTKKDVWQYVRENNVPYCYLYDEGATRKGYGEGLFKRLGCVLCPFSSQIKQEEEYCPEIAKLWKLACVRLVETMKERDYKTKKGKPMKHRFETGEELYQWWTKRR